MQEISELVKISHKLEQNVTTLSGGEMQRVALGRMFTQDAAIYLMDEALTWLDAKLRILMRAEIKMMIDELGITVVFVTHDQEEALSMASSMVLINDGAIQQEGAPQEIYNDPNSMWVADFIGTPAMNFLSGKIRDDLVFDCGSGGIRLSPGVQEKIKERSLSGRDVVIGFRPEHIVLHKSEPDCGAVKCSLRAVEFTGYRTILDLCNDHGQIMKASVSAQYDVPEKGTDFWMGWSDGLEIVFDQKTQKRLI